MRLPWPEQAYARFYREIEALKTLDHPCILKIVDHSEVGAKFHFYVMHLIPGARPLADVIFSPPNPFSKNPVKCLDLLDRILDVLMACGSNTPQILHRDLKPANILLLPDDSVRIIDFGICQIEGATTITLVDEGVGAQNYMAPECESGAEGQAGPYSDLYSVGKILWSSITGMRAFARESSVFNGKSMPELFPDDPATWHLFHVFKNTIRRNPADRMQTAATCRFLVRRLRELVVAGYPPLELIKQSCPICGVGTFDSFQGSHIVFGNPNPEGIYAFQCSYCHTCFAIDTKKRNQELKERKHLE
jgi:serine/threonine protein kinase